MEQKLTPADTITAIATPAGTGGIAVIRISGPEALAVTQKIWKGKKLSSCQSHSAHLGRIVSPDGETVDEALLTVFLAPHSFTGEDSVEISCHGSAYIQRAIIHSLIHAGARLARHGEFSQRAFLNGRIDLTQAEAIADLISASGKAAHRVAMSQIRGDFSSRLEQIRTSLVDLASLLELELDFSEEDVEFADRSRLTELSLNLMSEIDRLISSYATGNAYKNGVTVAIAGTPNAGKSTLLNHLLSDNKAIVSDIPGTTRDTIEDTIEIDGILYRFIDTAGLHQTQDPIEKLGIQRTLQTIAKARIIIWLVDPTSPLDPQISGIRQQIDATDTDTTHIIAVNKADLTPTADLTERLRLTFPACPVMPISAKTGQQTGALTERLKQTVSETMPAETDIIITNARHYEALVNARESLSRTIEGIRSGISADFIAQDLRETLHHIGSITGSVTTDTLLQNIFSRFCIGK